MKLTDSEKSILLKLLKDGPQRYTELAKKTDLSPGGLSKVLQNLQKKGLIRREQRTDEYPPPVIYYLTERGVEVAKELAKTMMKETIYRETEEAYMALMKFDPEEAEKLLEELKKKIEELKQK